MKRILATCNSVVCPLELVTGAMDEARVVAIFIYGSVLDSI